MSEQRKLEDTPSTISFPELVDGVSNRMVKLRGYGNAIVVPQAKEFIQSYMESVDR